MRGQQNHPKRQKSRAGLARDDRSETRLNRAGYLMAPFMPFGKNTPGTGVFAIEP